MLFDIPFQLRYVNNLVPLLPGEKRVSLDFILYELPSDRGHHRFMN